MFGTSTSSGTAAGALQTEEEDATTLFAKMAYKTIFDWAHVAYPEAFQ